MPKNTPPVNLRGICPLAAGMPYPTPMTRDDFQWNKALEGDFAKFLQRKVFEPILEPFFATFKRIAMRETLESVRLHVDTFKFQGTAGRWAMQETTFIPTATVYTEGKITIKVVAVIDGEEVQATITDLFWRPAYSFQWRIEQAVRDLLRAYRITRPINPAGK